MALYCCRKLTGTNKKLRKTIMKNFNNCFSDDRWLELCLEIKYLYSVSFEEYEKQRDTSSASIFSTSLES